MEDPNSPEGVPSNIALSLGEPEGVLTSPTAEAREEDISGQNGAPLAAQPNNRQGLLLSAKTVAHLAKFHGGSADDEHENNNADDAGEEEESCGICLENPGRGRMVLLSCCKNVVCMKDAQLVGACPFCREEPLVWDIKE